MKIHEYQAKALLKSYGILVPEGAMAVTADEAGGIAADMKCNVVIKAQIHAGGRGKGGGIKLAENSKDASSCAQEILGMTLVTHQTGPEGKVVGSVLVEEALSVKKELYLGMVLDRATEKVTFIASQEGGMEIEVVAAKTPEKIIKVAIDSRVGIQPFQARKIAYALGLEKPLDREGVKFAMKLYRLFMDKDASLVEINPVVITEDNRLLAADAKINFDDNASCRHPDIAELRDLAEEEPTEVEASRHNLSYVKLDGTVGCMVNGAGLAMGTMDIIKHYGGFPANFLDVGGGASADRVEQAFKILLSDPKVKAVLINIFGGIVRCDRVANGVVQAAKRLNLTVPIVVRLAGTNSELAGKILEESGLTFTVATDLADAAEKAVAAAQSAA
ncbi:ADP-forming succinate--CoA ligase subunit beta [bacterium]|nr:ADP-forming succinate--CoA ligase subunit beta [bacterium]